jgi:hypothetical protein
MWGGNGRKAVCLSCLLELEKPAETPCSFLFSYTWPLKVARLKRLVRLIR